MSNYIRHSYHLVDESPWPLYSAISAFYLTSGLIKWFHFHSSSLLVVSLVMLLTVMLRWWGDISFEAANQGLHSAIVQIGMRWGMILFIVSEVFFFISFFWSFFHSSLAPDPQVGMVWPPIGTNPFNPFQVPLLNTLVLLSSGVSVTWAHHAIMSGDHTNAKVGLVVTVILGLYFTSLQALEYYEASFSIADSIYGSVFFVATGFHGLHVIVGTTFLTATLIRLMKYQFSASHHFGFEAAAWYWHFVDVVWLFLYLWLYWWSAL